MSQYGADAVGRPNVPRVVPENLFVHGDGSVLVLLLLLLVFTGLV